jgi:hypothetical protein
MFDSMSGQTREPSERAAPIPRVSSAEEKTFQEITADSTPDQYIYSFAISVHREIMKYYEDFNDFLRMGSKEIISHSDVCAAEF